jgi:hypothetical protein
VNRFPRAAINSSEPPEGSRTLARARQNICTPDTAKASILLHTFSLDLDPDIGLLFSLVVGGGFRPVRCSRLEAGPRLALRDSCHDRLCPSGGCRTGLMEPYGALPRKPSFISHRFSTSIVLSGNLDKGAFRRGPQPTAEASEKALGIARDAAISRLRPIADGPNQWEVCRSSTATDGPTSLSGSAVGTESIPGLGSTDTRATCGRPSQT